MDNTIDAGLINEPPALTYDFGDLPDTGSGTGVGNYQTLSGDSGPRHTIAGGVTLGAAVDAEADGQPNATATGDDANGSPDDEDGVSFPVLSPGSSGYIVVNTVDDDATACVNVFIDYNADGDFADADEHVISNSASLGTGTNNFYVTAPATATGLMGARVRVTDGCGQGGQSPTGNATTGEVEDYLLGAIGDYVWNDLDGDGAQDEPASAGQNGVVVRLYYDLGASGVFFAATTTTANDSSGNPGYYEFPGLPVGNYIVEFVAPAGKQFTTADATADDQDSDANTATGRTASTAISAGELDPTIDAGLITVLDFGDLPDTGAGTGAANYQTLSSDSGPSHAIVTGLRFGATVDGESDGQPNATASGDGADEDGLAFPTPLVAGRPVNLTLNGGAAADNQYCINLFADFNSDGDFADSGEHAISESLRSTGSQGLVFSSPSTATGAIGVRVRMTDACGQNGNSPTGAAVNGEVEDYLLGAIGDYVWFDANSDGVQNEPANQGQDGVVVRLLDGLGNPVLDGNGSAITTTTATRNGNPGYYEFAGLPAGNYIVEFVAPVGQDFTQTGQGTAATDSDANVSTGRSGLINLTAGEVDDTIDAGLVNEPVTGTCNQSDADYLLTNIIGAGMGSMTKHKASQRMVIPNWQTVDSLYAQLAGKQNGLPKYVRFMYTAKNYIQDEVIDSPASQTYAVFWYGEELDPAPAITGRWFLNKVSTKNHVPRALVLYPTYRTTVPYINVFEPIQAADTQVYWNTAAGWVPTTSYTLDIPAPLAPATLTVKVAQVDNDKDERPVSITVTAGGVSVTQSPVAPNSGDQLDILTFVLPNVPAGTNEVVITSVSYGPNTNGLGALGGDSTAIIGATANYACN